MGKTIAEKILGRASGQEATAGEIVNAEVDKVMSHDNAALVIKKFEEIGIKKVWDNKRIVIPIDHRVPANSIKTAEGHKSIREFVRQQGIINFYDIKEGICHQVMVEKGHAIPGTLICGTDSHTTTYGAFGAFSTGIGATDMAAVWATGKIWLKVPETIKIIVDGYLPEMVSAKDVILNIIGEMRSDGANYKSCEFYGEIIKNFSISGRMTIANMAMEMGAKAGIIPPDEKTIDYLKERTKGAFRIVLADKKAGYDDRFNFDVSDLEPQIACPHRVDNVKSVREIEGLPIDQAVLGSCTNGRIEDFQIAAKILNNKKVNDDVRMLVVPASREVYLDALRMGLIEKFIRSNAIVLNPGCGPCLGAHQGVLASGERAITTTNRNFKGRMGSTEAEIYLASPATVAASALKGEITDPRDV